MPRANYQDLPYDPSERPDVSMEILGRGAGSRRSKSFYANIRIATQLAFIRSHYKMLLDIFRRLHAHHYQIEVTQEDGSISLKPEVLDDRDIHRIYPAVYAWAVIAEEVSEHYPSIDGFSIDRTTGRAAVVPTDDKRQDSSAGADRNVDPSTHNPRWK